MDRQLSTFRNVEGLFSDSVALIMAKKKFQVMFGGSLMELKLQSFNRLLLEFLFKLCLQPHVKRNWRTFYSFYNEKFLISF